MVIIGFDKDEHKELGIAIGLYVIVTDDKGATVSYEQGKAPNEGEKYSFVTYNEAI